MFKNNNWLKSLSVVLAIVLILTAVGSYLPPGQDIAPFISGSVNASPEQQLKELMEAYNRPDQSNPVQYMEFKPDAEDGKVSVIIGFTGEPARGAQRQAKLAQQKTLVESFGGEVKRDFTIINAVTAHLPLQAVEALSKRHDVSYIEPDYKVSLIAQETPWGIDRVFGPEKYSFPTWDYSRGQGIAVAVLDTGIDENHIDLPALLGGVNTVDSTHWGSDGHGHGTHVAGTIAAVDNDMGVVGASPGAGLYAVKVLNDSGWGTYSSIIAGIEWAFNNNIPVMNMSLGGGIHSDALKDAVDAAYAGGTLLVAAAGNDGDSTDNVLYPARYSSVIAVSASDSNYKLASFSSRGPSIEFIAPGVSILSLYPGNYMVRWSGTSMATPHVAGSAAVLWGANTALSNVEVRNILRQTAHDLGLSSDHQGYGLVRTNLAVVQALPALSSNANLSALTVSEGTLNPVFDSSFTDYTVDVADYISSINITATLSDPNSSLTITGEEVTSGEPETVTLGDPGTETEIDIVVTAEDGVTEKTHMITVERFISLDRTFINFGTMHDPGFQGWVSSPENRWQLAQNLMFTRGWNTRETNAYFESHQYSDLDFTVRLRRINSDYSRNAVIIRSGGLFDSLNQIYPSYVFGYNNSGQYSITRYNWNGTVTTVTDWTPTGAIVPKGFNDLKVRVRGSIYRFYINGEELETFRDDAFRSQGMVGVQMYRGSDDPRETRFDVVWARLVRLN